MKYVSIVEASVSGWDSVKFPAWSSKVNRSTHIFGYPEETTKKELNISRCKYLVSLSLGSTEPAPSELIYTIFERNPFSGGEISCSSPHSTL
ncbi:hypothetical protein VTK73DRAFT_8028 [Phialemonium thermophilum]|uniref:Uncharacterized protein n=1 Tax=Phialemonium thermophilum TaxID=223376 RepID=A0ABR3WB56_9PEZI